MHFQNRIFIFPNLRSFSTRVHAMLLMCFRADLMEGLKVRDDGGSGC